jgi:hypothetical protein
MARSGSSFSQALAALESEWRDIVREHGDLACQPYDLERDTRHEVRLLRYKATWDQLVATVVSMCASASDKDTTDILTLQ